MTYPRFATLVAAAFIAQAGLAQAQQTWVQIEAQPNLRAAEERARAYANVFPGVQGFAMNTGWYAIALGPFGSPAEAERQLRQLRGDRMIPGDSYLADGGRFRQQFWPAGGQPPAAATPIDPGALAALPAPDTAAPPAPTELPAPGAPAQTAPAAEPVAPVLAAPASPAFPDETPAEAQASEARLSDADRRDLQAALQWAGFYSAAIDGAFGRGTRASMAAWQAAQGYEQTGILTSAQRAELTGAHDAAMAALGIETVTDEEAGITAPLPLGLVEFAAYEPPLVRYAPKDGSGVTALLISQQGNQATLYALYDQLAALDLVPAEGPRERGAQGFRIEGRDGTRAARAEVSLQGGLIKGWLLSWPVARDAQVATALETLRAGFRATGEHALDAGAGVPSEVAGGALLAGLDEPKPARARSGLFVDRRGTVLTTTEAVAECRRITIDAGTEATVTASDAGLGLALLTPAAPLAPPATATFAATPPRAGAEAAVAGFAWAEQLDQPVMTFGRVAAAEGLDGQADLARLDLSALEGDTGGPVVDATGAVTGLLLPKGRGDGKVLPDSVGVAIQAPAIAGFLSAQGLTPAPSTATGALPAEELTAQALKMTTRVSCWDE
ncbi:trypsin-like peptidase domain-containing protein [Frigidibacter sp. MR17.24]|uniref:trypsin-like peptidase domain-containing protein n=1 Tax=Frigidibacter sp. MR17.24 TaxID=3127345 RepID=UPI003012B3FB